MPKRWVSRVCLNQVLIVKWRLDIMYRFVQITRPAYKNDLWPDFIMTEGIQNMPLIQFIPNSKTGHPSLWCKSMSCWVCFQKAGRGTCADLKDRSGVFLVQIVRCPHNEQCRQLANIKLVHVWKPLTSARLIGQKPTQPLHSLLTQPETQHTPCSTPAHHSSVLHSLKHRPHHTQLQHIIHQCFTPNACKSLNVWQPTPANHSLMFDIQLQQNSHYCLKSNAMKLSNVW